MASSVFLECFGLSPSSSRAVARQRSRCSSDDGMYGYNAPTAAAVGDDEVGVPFSVALKRQSDAALHENEVAAGSTVESNFQPNATSPATFVALQPVSQGETLSQQSSSSSSSWSSDDHPATVYDSNSYGETRLRALGILSNKPCRPEYVTLEARLGSFMGSTWPTEQRVQQSAELAEAGLFYTGRGDCVKCFFCGGRLRHWHPNDDVWQEHARWYPHCAFVHNVKGRHFIEHAAKRDNPEDLHAALMTPVSSSGSSSSAQSGSSSSGDEILHSGQVSNRRKFKSNTGAGEHGPFNDFEHAGLPLGRNSTIKKQRASSTLTPACRICLDRDVCIAFLPCGHLAACAQCAPALRDCPICRAKILSTVRTYMV